MQSFEQFHSDGIRAQIRRYAGPEWQVNIAGKGRLAFFAESTRESAEARIQEVLEIWGHICDERCAPWSAVDEF